MMGWQVSGFRGGRYAPDLTQKTTTLHGFPTGNVENFFGGYVSQNWRKGGKNIWVSGFRITPRIRRYLAEKIA